MLDGPSRRRLGFAPPGANASLMARGSGWGTVALAFTWQDVVDGTQGAPWVWWALALVVMLVLLLLGMRLLGLFPE